MTPVDYDFLRRRLKERSGLMLSGDKQYLVESRLLPIAREAGFGRLDVLVAALRQNADDPLMTKVVEAMTTNETFFFGTKLRSRFSVLRFCRSFWRRAGLHAASVFGARRLRPVKSLIHWPWR